MGRPAAFQHDNAQRGPPASMSAMLATRAGRSRSTQRLSGVPWTLAASQARQEPRRGLPALRQIGGR
jgi:hypothetical protein